MAPERSPYRRELLTIPYIMVSSSGRGTPFGVVHCDPARELSVRIAHEVVSRAWLGVGLSGADGRRAVSHRPLSAPGRGSRPGR